MVLGVFQDPIHVIFRIPLVRIFTTVLELNNIFIYLPFRFLTPCVCFFIIRSGMVNRVNFWCFTIRPIIRQKIDGTIEITSGNDSDFWMGAWGDSIVGVGFIMDLGIIPNFNAAMFFPTQLGSYHNGSGGEFLGNSIFHGEYIQPKNVEIYHVDQNRLVQAIEWQINCHGAASYYYSEILAFNFCNMLFCGGGVNHRLSH